MAAIWANPTTRIAALLLAVAGVLECGICVAAHSLGRRERNAEVAQVKNEAEEARKDDAELLEREKAENADLAKQLDRANAKLNELAEKQAATEKELVRLRADRDAAVKESAEAVRRYESRVKQYENRVKQAEDAAAESREVERRARLAADSVRRDAVAEAVKAQADAADAIRAARQKQGGKNGRNKVARGRGQLSSLPRTTPSFSELDKNEDGRLSFAEYKAGYPDATKDEFNALDANHDGYLSIDEYKAGHPDPPVVRVPRGKKN